MPASYARKRVNRQVLSVHAIMHSRYQRHLFLFIDLPQVSQRSVINAHLRLVYQWQLTILLDNLYRKVRFS